MPASQASRTPAAKRWASDTAALRGCTTPEYRVAGAAPAPARRYYPGMPDSTRRHYPHPRAHAALLAALGLCLASGAWRAWTVARGGGGGDAGPLRAEIEDLRQQVATLTRSDQVSREANID